MAQFLHWFLAKKNWFQKPGPSLSILFMLPCYSCYDDRLLPNVVYKTQKKAFFVCSKSYINCVPKVVEGFQKEGLKNR